jgi:serine/threonine-protein kinase
MTRDGVPSTNMAIRQGSPTVLSGALRSYEIIEKLAGRRGVHLARQKGELGFTKLVDIKTIPGGQAEQVHALVVDEARLRHANIVSTIDVLVEKGAVHVVMEHVDGSSLAEILRTSVARKRRLPVQVAAAIMHDVLLGLDHAHGAHSATLGLGNMLRCDVSPPNLLVGNDGLTRLIDLGAPRSPSSDETPRIGAPDYLAPEQLDGGSVDRTADVYACGVLLWELLTGERLFRGVRAGDVKSVVKPSSRARGISRKLDAVVMRALHSDPRERYETAAYMAKALAQASPLATRATVTESVRELVAGLDVFPVNVEPGRSIRERLASVVAKLHALTSSAGAALRQLSFAARVLLAFSVVSILALGLIAGRGRSTATAKSTALDPTPAAVTSITMAKAEEPSIEIDDVPPPETKPAPALAKPIAVRRAPAKPNAKSVAAQLLR